MRYEIIERAGRIFSLNPNEKEMLANKAGLSIYGIENFHLFLKNIIASKKIKDKELYSSALISERMYHYICSGKYITKYSLISIGIILNMDYEKIDDLLIKAGYKFSNSIAYDAVIKYQIVNINLKGIKLLDTINDTLYTLKMPLLMTRSNFKNN